MNKKFMTMIITAALAVAMLSGCGCRRKDAGQLASPSPTAAAIPEATTPADASTVTPAEDEMFAVDAPISNEAAITEMQKVAKNLMGESTIVLPSNDGKATQVDINGEKRICYMFGAATLDLNSENPTSTDVKNFYFDASTGEIFEITMYDTIIKIK